jgi:cyclopropane fatty-acyl-phospholipid synthase-like methyltransferase
VLPSERKPRTGADSGVMAVVALTAVVWALVVATAPPPAPPEVPYVPTPAVVVERMLDVAGVKEGDVVYDLGCGDGRIVIAAVKRPGVRGVCVEVDPTRLMGSRMNARKQGVEDRIRFVERDLFKVPLHEATVVALYLLPEVNARLRPRLRAQLRPGARVVYHDFGMGDWKPDETVVETGSMIYLWRIQ